VTFTQRPGALEYLVDELERDRSLDEPENLRLRDEALDRLDGCLFDWQPQLDECELQSNLIGRARALVGRLGAANLALYRSIRTDIQQGAGPGSLLRLIPGEKDRHGDSAHRAKGEGYDYLDELLGGIFQFETPDDAAVRREPELVPYQPTPARHIFDLIDRLALTDRDVLIDLGSGLGHVPMLASLCAGARAIGIEMEASYVESARRSAQALNLRKVTFIQQDARAADLSEGTVFYLYTPFTGSVLRTVLDNLHREASRRPIRIATYGPCVPTIASEPWIHTCGPIQHGRIAVFHSRDQAVA
jgi:hypothetical protein